MVANVKEIYVCTSCGMVTSSNQKPEICSRCKNKFNIEDAGKFEYFWPKSPNELKDRYIDLKVEEALKKNEADKDKNGKTEPENIIKSKIQAEENNKYLKFLHKTTVPDIEKLLDVIGYLSLVAPYSSSEILIRRLLLFYKQLEKPMAVLDAMAHAGSAGLVNIETILKEK